MSGIRQPKVVITENTVDPAEKLFIDGDDKNVAATVISEEDIREKNKQKFITELLNN